MNLENEIKNLSQNSLKKNKGYQKMIQKLKTFNSFDVDEIFHTQHDQVFSEIDCQKCGNCCKTTPPLLLNEDITRISKKINISTKNFIRDYLIKDEDGDLIFNKTPCPFLGIENFCTIYEVRPNACREYPHTNRKKMHQILSLTVKNAEICPAVVRILDHIEASIT